MTFLSRQIVAANLTLALTFEDVYRTFVTTQMLARLSFPESDKPVTTYFPRLSLAFIRR